MLNDPCGKLYVKKGRFAPKWYFVLGTLCLVALFISLGFWQLSRAEEKRALQTSFEARAHLPALTLQETTTRQDVRYYPVKVTGHYDNAHTILLDNKIYQHRVGYDVLTPLIADTDQRVVLVNRGWVAAGANRTLLPAIPNISGSQTAIGIIYIPPGKAFTLGNLTENAITWPLRVQALDIPALASVLHQPLYPFVVLLSADDKPGFIRDWQPVSMPPHKHVGYAVQWFMFALVLIIIFLALNLRKSAKQTSNKNTHDHTSPR